MTEGRFDVLYRLSALLGFQLLPQPRLFRCRGKSAARSFRVRSHGFNRMSCGQVLHLAWSWCRRKRGGCSVRRAEMAAWMRSYLQPSAASAAGNLALNQPAYRVPLTDKGSEEGWRR